MKEQVTVAFYTELRQQGIWKARGQKEKAELPASEDASAFPDHPNINPDSTAVEKSRVALLRYIEWVRGPEWHWGRAHHGGLERWIPCRAHPKSSRLL
jgi:hypothetical protein